MYFNWPHNFKIHIENVIGPNVLTENFFYLFKKKIVSHLHKIVWKIKKEKSLSTSFVSST